MRSNLRLGPVNFALVSAYFAPAWGREALPRFNGMFALACYNRSNGKMLLARDHVGIKPLYIMIDIRGVVFASQFDQIMMHPWALGREVDSEALEMYFRLGHIPAPRAYLKGTFMMKPGEWIEVDLSGKIERGSYFNFSEGPEAGAEPLPTLEELESVIVDAVHRQSVGDVPVGCFLSGGIDSPLITSCFGATNPLGASQTETFSVGIEGPDTNEINEAAAYASAMNIKHHWQMLTATNCLDSVEEMIDATHEPLADEGIIPSLLV